MHSQRLAALSFVGSHFLSKSTIRRFNDGYEPAVGEFWVLGILYNGMRNGLGVIR